MYEGTRFAVKRSAKSTPGAVTRDDSDQRAAARRRVFLLRQANAAIGLERTGSSELFQGGSPLMTRAAFVAPLRQAGP